MSDPRTEEKQLTPRQKVAQEPCRCVSCSTCGGSGNVWFSFGGDYLGNRRCDDLDQLEPCEECSGGVVEVCDRCQLLEEMDWEEQLA